MNENVTVRVEALGGKTSIHIEHPEPIDQVYLAAIIVDLGNKILKQGLGFADDRMMRSVN